MRIPVVRGNSTEQLDLVPSKIIGIGLNYRAHALEMGMGSFDRFASTFHLAA